MEKQIEVEVEVEVQEVGIELNEDDLDLIGGGAATIGCLH